MVLGCLQLFKIVFERYDTRVSSDEKRLRIEFHRGFHVRGPRPGRIYERAPSSWEIRNRRAVGSLRTPRCSARRVDNGRRHPRRVRVTRKTVRVTRAAVPEPMTKRSFGPAAAARKTVRMFARREKRFSISGAAVPLRFVDSCRRAVGNSSTVPRACRARTAAGTRPGTRTGTLAPLCRPRFWATVSAASPTNKNIFYYPCPFLLSRSSSTSSSSSAPFFFFPVLGHGGPVSAYGLRRRFRSARRVGPRRLYTPAARKVTGRRRNGNVIPSNCYTRLLSFLHNLPCGFFLFFFLFLSYFSSCRSRA